MQTAELDRILEKHRHSKAALLAILQEIQQEANWLSRPDLEAVARGLGLSLAHVYGMATFFKSLSLEERGRHVCTVCMGTACHVRGAAKLVDQVERQFEIKPGETTPDGHLTLETVACLGACALGALVVVDGEYHGTQTPRSLEKTLSKLKHDKAETKPEAKAEAKGGQA